MTNDQQQGFFQAFGFLIARGLLADDIAWITDEHARIFRERGIEHTGEGRSMIVPFIDQSERLCSLLDHAPLLELLTLLLGEDFNYAGSDGNYYAGETGWHSDGSHAVGTFLKVAIYLDPVTADTGALRVIPGSHRFLGWESRSAGDSAQLWGIEGNQVPAVALESQPGDVVLFNHNLMHSSWGGSRERRMFTMNCTSRAQGPHEVLELQNYVALHHVFGIERMHSDLMRDTASPARMRHLEQVIDNEWHLSAITAAAKDRAAKVS